MKVRFPLVAQILLWCVLNLVFLAAIFYLFFKAQFGFGLDSFLKGGAGERVEAVSHIIVDQMRSSDPTNWTSLLTRFSSAYHVQFYLFSSQARQIAGLKVALPAEVVERIGRPFGSAPWLPHPDDVQVARQLPSPPFFQSEEIRRAPGPESGVSLPPMQRSLGSFPAADRPAEPGPVGPPKGLAHTVHTFHPSGAFLHTFHPSRYWVLVRLPTLGSREHPDTGIRGGLILAAMSDTMSGGGLFFDAVPWIEVGFGALLVSLVFWFPWVRGITRSISRITAATEQIAEGRFDVRIRTHRSDELGSLSHAINQMAERLAGFVQGQRRFLGDIAHEVCSPLARAQMALSLLEQRAGTPGSSRLEDLGEEIRQMAELVNELLSFSQAGLKRPDLELKSVCVSDLVKEAIRREAPESMAVKTEVDSDLRVLAEPELLYRALANVLRNAVRYAGSAGAISVTAERDGATAMVRVADCGPGVPEETLKRIFDPFYRVEGSRSRESGGIGLGLAIVKTCVEGCRGQVSAKNRVPSGLEIDLRLQVA